MRRLLIALIASCLASPAAAHRQPEVETTLEVAHGGEAVGITHRLHAHDAMTLLRALGVAQPDLAATDDLARIAAYAAQTLRFEDGVSAEPIGAEVEGNYVFVYAVHEGVAGVTGSTFLDEVIPGWTDTVHAKGEDGRTTRSVTFDANREALTAGEAPIVPGVAGARDARPAP